MLSEAFLSICMYLTYKWTCICPLSQITPLWWLLTYTSHKHATLSIYMLLKTYLDMYMSIKPNHTIDMTVNIHIQQTCCQLTIQHLYSINGGVTFYLYSIFIFIFNWMVVAPLAVHQSSNGLSYKWNKITSLPHCEAKEWVKTIHNVSKAGWHASSGEQIGDFSQLVKSRNKSSSYLAVQIGIEILFEFEFLCILRYKFKLRFWFHWTCSWLKSPHHSDRFTWIWATRISSKGSKLLFPVII